MTAFLLALGVIIVCGRVAAVVSARLGLPSMVGALLVGVAFSPSLLNLYGQPFFADLPTGSIGVIAELGFLALVFGAGLELRWSDVRAVGRAGSIGAVLGVLMTILVILPAMLLLGFAAPAAWFTAIALAGTGSGVAAQIVFEMRLLKTRVGAALLYAATLDDIFVILGLSLLVAAMAAGSLALGDLFLLTGRMIVYVGCAAVIAFALMPRLIRWSNSQKIAYGSLSLALVSMLLLAWGAETLGGMTSITGAFIAGLGLGQMGDRDRQPIESGMTALREGLLLPVFLVNLGLRVELDGMAAESLGIIALLTVLASAAKVIGCGGGAWLGGFSRLEALRLGVAMIPRGAVGLAVMGLGLRYDLLPADLFPQLVIVVLATTILAPPFVRWLSHRAPPLFPPKPVTESNE